MFFWKSYVVVLSSEYEVTKSSVFILHSPILISLCFFYMSLLHRWPLAPDNHTSVVLAGWWWFNHPLIPWQIMAESTRSGHSCWPDCANLYVWVFSLIPLKAFNFNVQHSCQSIWASSQILTPSSCDPPIWWKSLHIFHPQNENCLQKLKVFQWKPLLWDTHTSRSDTWSLCSPAQRLTQEAPSLLSIAHPWALNRHQDGLGGRHCEADNQSFRQQVEGMEITLQLAPPLPGVQLGNVPIYYTP